MDTPDRQEEEKPNKRWMVVVTDTTVNPRAMVVHLQHTPEKNEEEEEEEEEEKGGREEEEVEEEEAEAAAEEGG